MRRGVRDEAYEHRHSPRRVEKVCFQPPLARALQHPSRPSHVRCRALPVSLMALLKAATPAFLTPHRNLTEVPCCVRLFSRSRRYSDAAAGRPQSTSARRRAPHRLSSTARTKSGIWRLLRLKNSTLLPRDHRGAVPDAHGGSWRAHRATTPRRGRTRAPAAARMWAATGACWRQERAAARAAVWVACVERAGPRPTAAVWSRGRPAARSTERRFSVPSRRARLRPLGRRGGSEPAAGGPGLAGGVWPVVLGAGKAARARPRARPGRRRARTCMHANVL
jgi:hypothetical protein